MSVIQFDESDYLSTMIVEAGIYTCEVCKIDGPKASTSGKSVNYFLDIRITDGKFQGKEKKVALSDGVSDPSVIGSMQWFPTNFFLQIDQAIGNDDKTPKKRNFEPESILHKPLDVQWTVVSKDGILSNSIGSFYPAGYGKSAPAF